MITLTPDTGQKTDFIFVRVCWTQPPSRDDLSIQFNLMRDGILNQLVLDLYLTGTGQAMLGCDFESFATNEEGKPLLDSWVEQSSLSMEQFMEGAVCYLLFTPEAAVYLCGADVHVHIR